MADRGVAERAGRLARALLQLPRLAPEERPSDVERGGSAAPPRRHCTLPARHSMARLARSRTQPSRELYCSTPFPPPFCEPARLFCRCEPDELPKDLAEELPKELRYV